MDVSQVIW